MIEKSVANKNGGARDDQDTVSTIWRGEFQFFRGLLLYRENAESNRRGIGLVGSRHHFDACRLTMEPNPSETLAEALLMQKLLTINAHKNYDLQ